MIPSSSCIRNLHAVHFNLFAFAPTRGKRNLKPQCEAPISMTPLSTASILRLPQIKACQEGLLQTHPKKFFGLARRIRTYFYLLVLIHQPNATMNQYGRVLDAIPPPYSRNQPPYAKPLSLLYRNQYCKHPQT